MIDSVKKTFFQKIIDDTFGYYRIYDFLKLKLKGKANGQLLINSSKEFWGKIIGNDISIKHKQVIKIKDFFLTEWVPKLPGRVWTQEGQRNLLEGLNQVEGYYSVMEKIYEVLGPTGKLKVITGGYGSVRIKPSAHNDSCTLLNLVHVDDWHCDYGIPVVVSKPVYEQFLRYKEHEGTPWIEELIGVLYLDQDVPNVQRISSAVGAKLDSETMELLSSQPNLRKAFIYVSSPLDIKIRYNGSSPEAVAWALYKTTLINEPLRLTYARFDPQKQESLLEAVGFINQYVATFDGQSILTDFDGIQKRLLSASSLTSPATLPKQHIGTLRLIDKWLTYEKSLDDIIDQF